MDDVLFSSKSVEWETPQDLFDKLHALYRFTCDVCATHENAKVKGKYYTKEEDGLSKVWDNDRCWMNPPYGRGIGRWVKKAAESRGLVVMLLPARTDTTWFHEHIYKNPRAKTYFLRGRLKFGGSKNSAPFPSMIVVLGG